MLDGLVAVVTAAGPSSRDAQEQSLRRHLVLHGRDLHCGTERNSTQAVLLLELLHHFLGSVEPADALAGLGCAP